MRLALLLLLAPALAIAQPAVPPDAARPTGTDPLPRFGVLFDAGVPDGAVVAAVFRPVAPIRFSLGAAYNYAGYGMRGGVGWTPLRTLVSPTVNLELGRYFESDLTWIADGSNGVPEEIRPLLERVGYNYASAQIGVEFGSARRLSFNLRLGLSYVWTQVHGVGESIDAAGGTTATVEVEDPRFRATMPSLKIGVLYYF